MADPRGFLKAGRETPKRRPVDVRIRDWREVYEEQEFGVLQKQAGRCMDCGIPFCHQGCPLGNLIPEWNDLIWRNEKVDAIDRFMPPIIFQNSLDAFVQLLVRPRAFLVSIKTQSLLSKSNYALLKRHSTLEM